MNGIKNVNEIIYKIFELLEPKDQKKALGILIDILIASVLETLGVSMIIPLISIIATPEQLMSNIYVQYLMQIFEISTAKELIYFIGIAVVLFYLLKNFFLVFSSYIQNRFRFGIQTKLSTRMLKAYLARPYQFFVNTNSSEILRGIGGDVGCVKDAMEVIFNTLTQALTLIFVAMFLVYTDAIMALSFLLVSFLCMFFLVFVLRRKVSVLGQRQRVEEANTTKYSRELLDGIKDIFAARKQDTFLQSYYNAFSRKGKINITYFTLLDIPNRMIETSFIGGMIIIILVRTYMGIELNDFIPRLAAFAIAGIKLLPSMSTISRAVTQLTFQKPGIDEIYNNINLYGGKAQRQKIYGKEVVPFKSFSLSNVKWKYSPNSKYILDDIDLEIEAGDSIAFIGESGSGKTTLVDIILGLYTPQSGSVKVNGTDISKYIGDWNKLFAYVQQNVFLLDDTVRRNIAFGVKDEEIDDNRVWNSIRAAQLEDFVKNSKDGLDTIVGERGVKFSGGQKQRIAIARAFYFDSDIIVFDEATAALDSNTENAVMTAIDSLHGDKTLIIVAHRLSTIKNCDKVYEVKNGKIFEVNKSNLL